MVYTTTDERKIAVINFELKNELCGISSEPNLENLGYFIRSDVESPLLLVTIVGCHYLQVFGAVWYGDHVCCDPLSPPVSLLFVPNDPLYGIEKAACVFSAIFALAKDLISDHYEQGQP